MMNTNKNTIIAIFIILLAMIGAVFIFGHHTHGKTKLSWKETAYKRGVLLYFSKNKGADIVTEPVSRDYPHPKPKGEQALLTYVVTALFNGPTQKEQAQGYFSEIPQGTYLISVKETPSEIDVDISDAFTSGGGSNSMLQRYQELAKTIVSVPQRKPVFLKVEGKSLETLGGEGVMIHEPITDDPSVTQ